MRKLYLFAAMAAMLAACSENDLTKQSPQTQQTAEEGVVSFDAYTQRATTRAGKTDIMNLDALKQSGFGVFGYYTDNNDYEQSRIPDFMYNQEVTYETVWTYEPVKYWPNEYGTDAISDDNDRVTFFAYAPYVKVTPASGKLVKEQNEDDQWGITGMSRNSAAGDPLIKYIASFEKEKSVDLLWGVCDDTDWAIINGGSLQSINEGNVGLPWLNVQRPKDATGVNKRMKFTFKHALSQFSVNIDAFVDGTTNAISLTDGTKVYVRSISFTGFALKGALNLNNTEKDKALWMDYSGTADLESGVAITVYDGLKDGKEGTSGAVASNEKIKGLNPDIISNYDQTENKGNTTEGVTNVTKPLFKSPIVMVIPTGEDMEVEIVYDIETADKNLPTLLSDGKTLGSSIQNRISKKVSFGSTNMENGKHYTLNLHLGLNSVQFDAAVSNWEEASDKPEANLPYNLPSFTAVMSANPTSNDITITSAAQNYQFVVTGLDPNEAVSADVVGATDGVLNGKTSTDIKLTTKDLTTTATTADASGTIFVKLADDIAENTTVSNIAKNGYISVRGNTSGKEVRVSIAQLAHPLGLGVASFTDNTITLSSTAGTTPWAAVWGAATSWSVKKNGVSILNNTDNSSNFVPSTGVITLPAEAAVGDVYEITVKAGDADEETFVASVGGIYYSPTTFSVTYGDTGKKFEPIYVGNGTPNVSYALASSNGVATVVASGSTAGVITTQKAGQEAIDATLTMSDDTENGWYYTAKTKVARYTLKVNKQAATISFVSDTKAVSTPYSTPVNDCLDAKLKDAKGGVLTADGNLVNGAAITYEITAGNVDNGSGGYYFTINTNGKVAAAVGTPAGTYTLTIKAKVTDGTAYSYAVKEATYTLVFTATSNIVAAP